MFPSWKTVFFALPYRSMSLTYLLQARSSPASVLPKITVLSPRVRMIYPSSMNAEVSIPYSEELPIPIIRLSGTYSRRFSSHSAYLSASEAVTVIFCFLIG